MYLSGDDDEEGDEEADVFLIENLNDGDNVNGVDGAGAGVGEDGDEDVFLDVEGTGVEGELPTCAPEEDSVRDLGSHELTQRHHRYLRGDGRDRQRLRSVPEELVQEGEERARQHPKNPHPECQHWQGRVVCGGHR